MVLGHINFKQKFIWGLLLVVLVVFAGGGRAFAQPFLASFDCTSQTSVDVDECEALVALYNATGGESWTNSTGWLQNSDVCTWHGVACSSAHIVTLDLYSNNLTGSLPLEIGGFPYLKTLTLNGNPLTGPVPITITFLDLDLFHFHSTSMCEPVDPEFQDWFSQIVYRLSSGVYCATLVPTNTPNAAQTETAASVAENLPWPQQTLTAMAQDATNDPAQFGTPTIEPSPTKVSGTPTPQIIGDPDQVLGNFGGMQESETKSGQPARPERTGFLSNIPSSWLLLLLIPVLLIVVGVYLEMRDNRKEGRGPSGKTSSSSSGVNLLGRLGLGGKKEPRKDYFDFSTSTEAPKEEKAEEEDDYGDFDMYDFGQK